MRGCWRAATGDRDRAARLRDPDAARAAGAARRRGRRAEARRPRLARRRAGDARQGRPRDGCRCPRTSARRWPPTCARRRARRVPARVRARERAAHGALSRAAVTAGRAARVPARRACRRSARTGCGTPPRPRCCAAGAPLRRRSAQVLRHTEPVDDRDLRQGRPRRRCGSLARPWPEAVRHERASPSSSTTTCRCAARWATSSNAGRPAAASFVAYLERARRRHGHDRAGARVGDAAGRRAPAPGGPTGCRWCAASPRYLQTHRPRARGPAERPAALPAASGAMPYLYTPTEIAALMARGRTRCAAAARGDLPDADRAAGRHRDAGRRGDPPRPRRHRPSRPTALVRVSTASSARPARSPLHPTHDRGAARLRRAARPAAAARPRARRSSSSQRRHPAASTSASTGVHAARRGQPG